MLGYHAGRLAATAAGTLILIANTDANIAAHGLTGPPARLQLALALGIVAAASLTGLALRQRRYGLALLLMAALAAGEATQALGSAERVIAARDAKTAPAREAAARRTAALQRLTAAETATMATTATIAAKAAEKACASHCRALLEGTAKAAADELAAARAAVAALPTASESPTALADRAGVAGSTLDLVAATLASLAINGLAIALIGFGAHFVGASGARSAPAPVPRRLPRIRVADEADYEEAERSARDRSQTSFDDSDIKGEWFAERFSHPEEGSGPPRGRRDQVLAAILTDHALGKPFASQRQAAERFAVAPSTLSEWFKEWDAAGLVPARRTVGRCKKI